MHQVRESVEELEEVLKEKARKAKEALTRPLHPTSSSLGQAAETTMSKASQARKAAVLVSKTEAESCLCKSADALQCSAAWPNHRGRCQHKWCIGAV